MRSEGQYLDSITFAGNGEPTLHPLFPAILDDVIRLRDEFFPLCHVSVLSNATMIESEDVFKALLKADINILKLDSAIEETVSKINCPPAGFSLPGLLKNLKLFNGKLTIQTLFFRGIHNGEKIDNSSEKEVKAWIEALKAINPVNVMIYTLARDTAVGGLESLSPEELKTIALQVEKAGISTQVSP
jgi:wyosine [tRNA(Phe)-imidazoG37] synthetase (radical SAM superfamily)